VERECVGIDLHRRRSVIVRETADGELLSNVQIDDDPMALAAAIAVAGPEPEMVVEATSAASGRAAGDGGVGVGSGGRLPSRRASGCGDGRRQLDVTVGHALMRLRAYAFGNDRPLAEVAGDVVARTLRFDVRSGEKDAAP
jgi:hypothetical protein